MSQLLTAPNRCGFVLVSLSRPVKHSGNTIVPPRLERSQRTARLMSRTRKTRQSLGDGHVTQASHHHLRPRPGSCVVSNRRCPRPQRPSPQLRQLRLQWWRANRRNPPRVPSAIHQRLRFLTPRISIGMTQMSAIGTGPLVILFPAFAGGAGGDAEDALPGNEHPRFAAQRRALPRRVAVVRWHGCCRDLGARAILPARAGVEFCPSSFCGFHLQNSDHPTHSVIAGLDPAIQLLLKNALAKIDGCPGQARA